MTAADLWITASFTAQAPPPPPTPVYYDVTLPSVEGATTDPAAGTYSVEAKESFRFFLTLDEAYSQSQPVVITDRGETITPRTSDGAYIVKTVHSDVSISKHSLLDHKGSIFLLRQFEERIYTTYQHNSQEEVYNLRIL